MARPIDAIPQAHWDPKATTLREHLSAVTGGGDEAALRAANTREERLRYMHQHTLGCPDTFEFRRQELALLEGREPSSVTDEQVVENFIADIASEDGALRQYLAHADVAVVLGNTLFVHGAVDAQTMAFVPSHTRFELPRVKQPPAAAGMGVADWAAGLNRYLREGLADHAARPTCKLSRYRYHLGCILLKMPAISLLTGSIIRTRSSTPRTALGRSTSRRSSRSER